MANNKNCKGCIYFRRISCMGNFSQKACHYCIDTGKLRECDPRVCDKKDTDPEHRTFDRTSLAEWCLNKKLGASNGY